MLYVEPLVYLILNYLPVSGESNPVPRIRGHAKSLPFTLIPFGVHWLTRIRRLESLVQKHGDNSLYNLLSRKQYITSRPPSRQPKVWGQSEPQTIQLARESLFKKLARKRLECWNTVIGVDEAKNAMHIGQRAVNCTHCAMKMTCRYKLEA